MGALSWPEEALRANIIAQVSLALNRIWTEWYPSRGYSFNITGSPGYDQAYVNGRTVFAVMERLTAELFNTFVQRSGDAGNRFSFHAARLCQSGRVHERQLEVSGKCLCFAPSAQ